MVFEPIMRVVTARLELIAVSVEIAAALYDDRDTAAELLDAYIPATYPSSDLNDFLPYYVRDLKRDPTQFGWGVWLVIHQEDRVVIGDIGFKGKPDAQGSVEIGYGLVPAYHGHGLATEAAQALVAWAFEQPQVKRVTAACLQENQASRRVLEKVGMHQTTQHGTLLFWELKKPIMSITRLNHVQITIPKGTEDAGRAFYCGVLGLTEIEKPDSLKGRGGFWLQLGDVQVHIGTEDGVDRKATKAHVAYEVNDLEAWRVRLLENGVTIGDSVPIPGYERFEFNDPFGNRVELIQPAR